MDHVYAVTEVIGSSENSSEAAVHNAISTARRTLRNLEWFEITQIRGYIGPDGSVGHFQVGVNLGFRYEGK